MICLLGVRKGERKIMCKSRGLMNSAPVLTHDVSAKANHDAALRDSKPHICRTVLCKATFNIRIRLCRKKPRAHVFTSTQDAAVPAKKASCSALALPGTPSFSPCLEALGYIHLTKKTQVTACTRRFSNSTPPG